LQPRGSRDEDQAVLDRACQSFVEATGWQLEYGRGANSEAPTNLMWSAPVNPGVGVSPGHIRLFTSALDSVAIPLEQASLLAQSIGDMWGELLATRQAVWEREAELAAGVPLVLRRDDERASSLAERLESVLKAGAEAIGCQAAALYLLDAATTELKLRSSFGLPRRRLLDPARPLRPALADLEALLGHAVVMNEPALFDYWKVPEPSFRSAVCVPVSSPSMPLGTLWIYSDRVRDFSDAETNIVEVVAGRLASELERETLVEEAVATRDRSRRQHHDAPEQSCPLPSVVPAVEGWEIAAQAVGSSLRTSAFYDWMSSSDGSLTVVGGDMGTPGMSGALAANLVRGAARGLCASRQATGELVTRLNDVLWSCSSGDTQAGVVCVAVTPRAGVLELCSAGPVRVLLLSGGTSRLLERPSEPIGRHGDARFASQHSPLLVGDIALAYTTQIFGSDSDESLLAAFDQRVALSLEPHRHCPLDELAAIAGDVLAGARTTDEAEGVLLLIRRRKV
jgi:hypothetical protein